MGTLFTIEKVEDYRGHEIWRRGKWYLHANVPRYAVGKERFLLADLTSLKDARRWIARQHEQR